MRVLPASLLAAVAVTVLAAPAVGALSSPGAPARLRATSLTTTGKTLTGGTRFTVAGVVRNSGGTSSRAVLDFKLRSTGRPHVLIALGRASTPKVARGGTRRFRATLRLKASSIPDRVTGPFHVVVCVRRTATDRTARCRRSTTTVTVKGPKRTATTGGGSSTTTTPATVPKPAIVPTPTPTDTTAPTTGDDVPAVYRNAPIPVTLTAADEAGGSGVGATYYTTGASPADPTAASAAYAAGAKPTLASGEVIKYRSVDIAGNLEAVRTSRAALVDTVAPVTTDDVPATVVSVAPRATLQATDAGGSGVARTFYTVGASPAEPTTGSAVYDPAAKPVVPDGQRIRYFSVDVAGNPEAPHASPVVHVDPAVYTAGSRTGNDSLFPGIGNGGYNAQHYDLDLDYVISAKTLSGTTTATLKATQNLSRLTLDFAPWLRVSAVKINGAAVAFRQGAAGPATAGGSDYDYELDVTPAAPGIADGTTFDVAVTYSGVTQPVVDPDGADDGWIPDTVFGAIAVSEPIGAMGWFPNNNVPYDKATYTVRMTVPSDAIPGLQKPWYVVGTGRLVGTPTVAGGRISYVWDNPDPTASYLESVSIARFDVVAGTSTTPAPATNPVSVPFYTAIDSNFLPVAKSAQLTDLNRTPAILDYYADYYGVPYPFNAMGGVNPLQSVGYSLETQGKPTYAVNASPASTGAGIATVSHENGHMYFGDHLTLTDWKDIWLNEGMTEFSSWLWQANQNAGTALSTRFTTNYTTTKKDFWLIPTAAPPTGADIFDNDAMYVRGATTMVAIHEIFGDAAFRTLMHDWLVAPGHPGGNATTEQFIALVKAHDPARAARWDAFFQQWLYTSYPGTPSATNRPQITPANF